MNENKYQRGCGLFFRLCLSFCHGRLYRSLSAVQSGLLSVGFLFGLLPGVPLCGQEPGIRVEGDEGIIITPCGRGVLDFRCLTAGDAGSRSIGLHTAGDDDCVVLAVDAPQSGDLTVWIDAPAELIRISEGTREAATTLPFELRFAYANEGYSSTHLNISEARAGAVEIPAGIQSATFPVLRRMNGPPPPPPVPAFSGHQPHRARVYLFFYGTAWTAQSDFEVPAGRYEGEIVVNIALHQLRLE